MIVDGIALAVPEQNPAYRPSDILTLRASLHAVLPSTPYGGLGASGPDLASRGPCVPGL